MAKTSHFGQVVMPSTFSSRLLRTSMHFRVCPLASYQNFADESAISFLGKEELALCIFPLALDRTLFIKDG